MRRGPTRLGGNRLSNIFTSLCTDVDDPVVRLRAIRDVTKAAKELHEVLGPDLFESWIAVRAAEARRRGGCGSTRGCTS